MSKITIYMKSDCPYCLKTKELLMRNEISFQEIDVIQDEFEWKEMVKKSGQLGVPVIEINQELVIGYDEGKLRKMLKLTR